MTHEELVAHALNDDEVSKPITKTGGVNDVS